MSSLICDLCHKEFKRNSDLTKHKNRKTPCVLSPKIDTSLENSKETMSSKNSELITILKNCFDILRDNEHLVADKALRNVSYFLSLKLINPYLVSGGNANIKYSKEFACSSDNIIITSNIVLVKYLYYYLFLNIEILENGFKGSGIKHISKEYIQKIKIPIPSIEKQKEIIEYLENKENENKRLNEEINLNKKLSEEFLINSLKN
jgi:restriction endonuclease S subunit